MTWRWFSPIALLLLAACAQSPYEPGRSAADLPAKIDVVKLDKLASLDVWKNDSDPEKAIDPVPSDNDREVLAVVKSAVLGQFENFGMSVIEDDSRPADVRIAVYVAYTRELGLLVHRSVFVSLLVLDLDGNRILKERSGRLNQNGVFDAMFQSRDGMVAGVSQRVVQETVKELQKGTKQAVTPVPPVSPAPTVDNPTPIPSS